jgi:hypothetical protein
LLFLVEVLLRKMTDRFCGAFFDLSLDLSRRACVIDDDAELAVVNEEASCGACAVRIERNGLNSEVTNMAADDDTDKTEQPSFRAHVLGAVLHTQKTKHAVEARKGLKTP